ncbi:MAG: DMT family transporter [Paramuribaculum sp.]|nr:DMT family transporter [Paramuribaculum sp.]
MPKRENLFNSSPFGSSSLIYHLGAFIAVTAWGIAFINTKVLLNAGMSAVEVAVYRFAIAYICIFLICPLPIRARSISDELKFVLAGVCGNSIYFIAENTALKFTLVSNVSLIVAASPILTALLIGFMYKSEKPTRGFMVGSLIAMAGVGCVIFNSSFQLAMNPLGDMLALLAALCWAIYSIVLRPLNATYSVWFITRKTFFYGLITAIPFLALEPSLCGLDVLISPRVLLNLGFLALVCSVVSYVLWTNAIKRIGVVKSGLYIYVSPIVTLVASILYLGEPLSVIGLSGCALIIIGMVLSDKLSRRGSY